MSEIDWLSSFLRHDGWTELIHFSFLMRSVVGYVPVPERQAAPVAFRWCGCRNDDNRGIRKLRGIIKIKKSDK